MKFAAAILTMIAALLLLGLAHYGYTDNARIHAESLGIDRSNSHNIGRRPIPYTPRPAESWQAIDRAEEQGRLAAAGIEGFFGVMLLFMAVALCGPANAKTTIASSEYNLRERPGLRDRLTGQPEGRPGPPASSASFSAPLRPDRPATSSFQSGRARIEELRKPKPKQPAPIPSLGRSARQ